MIAQHAVGIAPNSSSPVEVESVAESGEAQKLIVGARIGLKGEVTNCDTLIIEGHFEGSALRGTKHQVPLDLHTQRPVPNSHEPPAHAVVFLDDDPTVVHFHDYLDESTLAL